MLNGATGPAGGGEVCPKISVVTPVFNSESKIPELYCRVKFTLEAMGAPFELVLVEDCSGDDSWRVLGALAQFDERVTALQLMRRSGKTAAALAGMSWAKGDLIVTIDDDLSYAPEDIPLLVHRLLRDEELDVVMGTRAPSAEKGGASAPVRRGASAVFAAWLRRRRARTPAARFTSFRAMRRQLAEALLTLGAPHPELNAMIGSITRRAANETVRPMEVIAPAGEARERVGARATALVTKAGARLGRFFGRSPRPLRALSIAGLAASVAAPCGFLGLYFAGGRAMFEPDGLALIAVVLAAFNVLALSLIAQRVDGVPMIWSSPSRWIVRRTLRHQTSQKEPAAVQAEEEARQE
jgi:hypothetical protein